MLQHVKSIRTGYPVFGVYAEHYSSAFMPSQKSLSETATHGDDAGPRRHEQEAQQYSQTAGSLLPGKETPFSGAWIFLSV